VGNPTERQSKMKDTTITMRCKAFSSEGGVRENRVQVSEDGTVRVWDSVAGHYTTCHVMTAAAQRRARKSARNV
jgi:hypothetical protein